MSTDKRVKKSIVEQMTASLSLIFAVILISIIAIPQVLQAFFRLIYWNRRKRKDVCGKLAIVAATGSDNELMKFISIKLARLGCNLVIIGDNLKEHEVNFFNDLKSEDVNVVCVDIDTGNTEEIKELYQEVIEEFGSIDMLINVPKLIDTRYVLPTSENDVTKDVNIAFTQTMFLTLSAIDVMKNSESKGHIVTISPRTGLSLIPSNYSSCSSFYSFFKSINAYVVSKKLEHRIQSSFVFPCCVKNGNVLSQFLSSYINFLPLKSEAIADEIIESILENHNLIEIPSNLMNLTRLLNYFKIF